MSRAVQEDLSDLSFGERTSKRFSNFCTWVYNSEDKSILGERSAGQWGQLLLYYLVFYGFLAGFTAIFFGVLGFMLPIRPNEVLPGICSKNPNNRDGCGTGPFFQIMDVNSLPGEVVATDDIYKFGVCEPAFVAIPRELSINGEPENGFVFDDRRKGYQQFLDEVNRVQCQANFNDVAYNPDCNPADIGVNQRILPLVPLGPNGTKEYRGWADLVATNTADLLKGGENYNGAKPIYSFEASSKTYETYVVFFKFNKVWNYQPYAAKETSKSGALLEPMENNIGITCSVSNPCKDGSAVNYKGDVVQCDNSTDITADGKVHISMLTNVMTNYDGFPWRGGALNMGFGSLAMTSIKGESFENFEIQCEMGVAIEESNGRSSVDATGGVVAASSKAIANFDKPGPARAYTSSKGSKLVIPVAFVVDAEATSDV